MRTARYGRMQMGRCVKNNLGYIGCFIDVISIMHTRSVMKMDVRNDKERRGMWWLGLRCVCVKRTSGLCKHQLMIAGTLNFYFDPSS